MGRAPAHDPRWTRGLADRSKPMPLTAFQAAIAELLAVNRSSDSYLAGGAALHIEPNSKRYSNDLDTFTDSEVRGLVGGDEPPAYLDIHEAMELLPLGVLCWAAAGKDPGFTPAMLLDLLR